jgi:hypothetical protein
MTLLIHTIGDQALLLVAPGDSRLWSTPRSLEPAASAALGGSR